LTNFVGLYADWNGITFWWICTVFLSNIIGKTGVEANIQHNKKNIAYEMYGMSMLRILADISFFSGLKHTLKIID